ncbi:MAG: helix-turn-helix transcriptional regulator [Bacteroidota bacterium]
MQPIRLTQNLKALRQRSGLTQEKLCDKIKKKTGYTPLRTTYSHHERGYNDPSILWLTIYASFYGVSVDELLHFEFKLI